MVFQMQCPACGHQFRDAHARLPDEDVACTQCEQVFEFRQWREKACKAHRGELLIAYPGLRAYFDVSVDGRLRLPKEIVPGRERRDE